MSRIVENEITAALHHLQQSLPNLNSMEPADATIFIEHEIDKILNLPATHAAATYYPDCRKTILSLLAWGAEAFSTDARGALLWRSLVCLDHYLRTKCIVMNTSPKEDKRIHILVPGHSQALAPKRCELPRLLPQLQAASDKERDAFNVVDMLIRRVVGRRDHTVDQVVVSGIGNFGWSENTAIGVIFIAGIKRHELSAESLAVGIPIMEISGVPILTASDGGRAVLPPVEVPHARDDAMLVEVAKDLAYSNARGYIRKQRRQKLEEVTLCRATLRPSMLVPGQSISGRNMEAKGTFSVFVRVSESNPREVHLPSSGFEFRSRVSKYGLTAFHVTNPTPVPVHAESTMVNEVITPGRLDILARIHRELLAYEEGSAVQKEASLENLKELVHRIQGGEEVGNNVSGGLGVDASGWREDWSLLEVKGMWVGRNDRWWSFEDIEAVVGEFLGIKNLSPAIHGQRQPIVGETVLKDGATSGVTVGMIGANQILAYYKSSVDPTEIEEREELVDVASHVGTWSLDGLEGGVVAARGDSGSPCLALETGENGGEGKLQFLGMVVSALDIGGIIPKTIGLLVPQQELFRQVQERTGIAWEVDVTK